MSAISISRIFFFLFLPLDFFGSPLSPSVCLLSCPVCRIVPFSTYSFFSLVSLCSHLVSRSSRNPKKKKEKGREVVLYNGHKNRSDWMDVDWIVIKNIFIASQEVSARHMRCKCPQVQVDVHGDQHTQHKHTNTHTPWIIGAKVKPPDVTQTNKSASI